jgi:hypothetical protein
MHASSEIRNVFLEWVGDLEVGRAAVNDAVVISEGEQFSIPKLLGSLSRCSDQLPGSDAWIVADNPDVVGRRAWHTYRNAVRVVRAMRR